MSALIDLSPSVWLIVGLLVGAAELLTVALCCVARSN